MFRVSRRLISTVIIDTTECSDDSQEIVAGFRALQASDFDYENINARGPERLSELTDVLMSVPEPERAVPEMFSVMERMREADLGSPGPLVHTMKRWPGGTNMS